MFRRVAALLLAVSAAAVAGEPPPPLDPALLAARDVFDLEHAVDPQISPDGRRVAYVRMSFDVRKDAPRANLWLVGANGEDHRPLLSGPDSHGAPRWSPDGTRLAYVSDSGGNPQLHVRWLDTGDTAVVTDLTEAPGELAWSPDGRWLAFTMLVPTPLEPLAPPPQQPEGASWAKGVTTIDRLVYRSDGAGFLERGFTHVFVAPADGGAARRLTQGEFNHGGPLSWSPDGRTLLLAANRAADWELEANESEVFALDVASGALTPLTSRKGPDFSGVFSPDGKRIAYLGYDDRRQFHQATRLYVMDANGANAREVNPRFDEDVLEPRWAPDGRSILFMHDARGVRKLSSVALDGRMREIASGLGGNDLGRPYTTGSFSMARTGAAAFTAASAQRPADVAVVAGGARRVVTALNEDLLAHKRLGAVRELAWKSSHDGREIQGWLVTPPSFDATKKYPLILEIHGGPVTAYGPTFATEIQRYAAAGYVVLYANPRGSTSYGEAFANLIHHAYPGNDYDDLMSGIDAALALGFVDPENLFVTGGSGGGVLTAWIVGKTARFRAAVVAKPVINWTSMVLTSDGVPFFYRYWFAKPPWEAPEEYWRRSPLSLVGNVKTPTMLITGEEDWRTPIGESEQYYAALKLRGVDTLLVRVPESSHDFALRPSLLVAKTDNILAWFERYRAKQEAP
jgi:dipeptidyl aminopeptidase/acylaminoacyl peptidase